MSPAIDQLAREHACRYFGPTTDPLLVRGWFLPPSRLRASWCRPPRSPDIDAYVGNHIHLAGSHQTGRVAMLTALYLPVALQGRGFGTRLLQLLLDYWAASGVQEVHASVGTPAGERALTSWGFNPTPNPDSQLPQVFRVLDLDQAHRRSMNLDEVKESMGYASIATTTTTPNG